MSNKLPSVFYPNIRFSCCGNHENGIGVGSFSIGACLPNGNQMDIAHIDFQNTPIKKYNEIDKAYKENGSMDALKQRASITRRLSKKQAAWLTYELVKRLNELAKDGIPSDDDLTKLKIT